MPLTEKHVSGICLEGQGAEACKYLGHCPDRGHICMKLAPEFVAARTRVEKLAASGSLAAQGDNCEGVLR